jgi:hypothetical protein
MPGGTEPSFTAGHPANLKSLAGPKMSVVDTRFVEQHIRPHRGSKCSQKQPKKRVQKKVVQDEGGDTKDLKWTMFCPSMTC